MTIRIANVLRSVVAPVLAVTLVALIKLGLDPVLGRGASFLFFYSAVMLCALRGGPESGLAAAVLSAVAVVYLDPILQIGPARGEPAAPACALVFLVEGG